MIHLFECVACGHLEMRVDPHMKTWRSCPMCGRDLPGEWRYRGYISPLRMADPSTHPVPAAS